MKLVRQRTLQWATEAGYVFLSWPDTMSPEDAADALSAIDLACRSLRRIADRRATWADFEAVMVEALEPSE